MRKPYTDEEEAILIRDYAKLGPRILADRLGRQSQAVSLKARKMGLYRGVEAGNVSRKRSWRFNEWSYDLGYIVGVYLGDGNLHIKPEGGGYFRLNVVDRDFCEATQSKLYALVGVLGSIKPIASTRPTWSDKWVYTLCNKDFVTWLRDSFGGPGDKCLAVLPDPEANKGMLEGLVDSEGTVGRYSIEIRMKGNLSVLASICDQLGIQRGQRHTGVRDENWYGDSAFKGFAISIAEFTRVGLGTHILRKAINGMRYKAP
jgi:hypothetical protein